MRYSATPYTAGGVDELYFAITLVSSCPCEMLLSERESGLRKTRLEIGPLGRMYRRRRAAKKIVRVREKCVTCKTDTNCLVTQRGCNTAGSFDLSDLGQTSEHQHKQFVLHCKQLTAS